MARIGLLSDSHGQAGRTAEAVRLLREAGAEILIHLGDVGSEEVLDQLICDQDESGQLVPEVHVVFGNTDYDVGTLGRYAAGLGICVDHPAGRLETGGRQVAFTHGHLQNLIDEAVADGVAYLCHGHTHQKRHELSGNTHLINPGALCRARTYTAAVLETETGHLQGVEIAR